MIYPDRLDLSFEKLESTKENIQQKNLQKNIAFAGNRTRGPSILLAEDIYLLMLWQRWILPLNHKRLFVEEEGLLWFISTIAKFNFVRGTSQ
jgi:hypothetical protein